MIDLDYIRSFFPPTIARESRFDRYMLKEYLQLLIFDHLATTPYISKVSFIGGTNLRLIQGIDRFSENLDFDCKDLSEEEFMSMIPASPAAEAPSGGDNIVEPTLF